MILDSRGRPIRKPKRFGFVPSWPIENEDRGGDSEAVGWQIPIEEDPDIPDEAGSIDG